MGFRRIIISGGLISTVLTREIPAAIPQNAPKDTRFVRAICPNSGYRYGPQDLEIIVESDEWEGPEDGAEIEPFTVIYARPEEKGEGDE